MKEQAVVYVDRPPIPGRRNKRQKVVYLDEIAPKRRKRRTGWRFAAFASWTMAVWMAKALLVVILVVKETSKWMTTGKQRAWFVPLWVMIPIAISSIWWVQAAVLWALVSYLVRRNTPKLAGNGASEREWKLLSDALFTACLWMLACSPVWIRGFEQWTVFHWVPWITLLCGSVWYSIPWWAGRRIRPKVEEPTPEIPQFMQDWVRVADAIPALAGTWLLDTWDSETNSGVLELSHGRADKAKNLAKDAQAVLSTRDGGIVMRTRGASYPVTHLVVQHVPNPVDRVAQIEYADPDTLVIDDKGRLPLGITMDGKPGHLRVRVEDGAAHLLVSGGTGSGKGVLQRLVAASFVMDPNSYVIALDMKGGSGIPSFRTGADIYARTKEQWHIAFKIWYDIMMERQHRYGELGIGGWDVTDGDPQIILMVDESFRFPRVFPKLVPDMDTGAAQGRSLGCSMMLATQVSDLESLGTTIIRSNIMSGGTAMFGRQKDSTARQMAVQDFDVDVSALPPGSGWFIPMSGVDPSSNSHPIRVLYSATAEDVKRGKQAPYGTIEEWMSERVQRATLHPDDQKIASRWEQYTSGRFEQTPNAHAREIHTSDAYSENTVSEPAIRRMPAEMGDWGSRTVSEPTEKPPRGESTSRPPQIAGGATESRRERIVRILRDSEYPMTPTEITDALGISQSKRGHVSKLLSAMEGHQVCKGINGTWKVTS